MRFSIILTSGTRRVRPSCRKGIRSAVAKIATARPFPDESITRYSIGGYHPVRLHDLFHGGRYQVIRKLGHGVYSTVWLVRNTENNRHVALKVLTADSFDGVKDTFELDILSYITARAEGPQYAGSHHILPLLDHFKHRGPNGDHVCLVFKAMGPDLSKYRTLFLGSRIPHPILKRITKQLLQAFVYLHETCQVIHTDVKPSNILIETSEMDDMFEHAPSEVFKPLHSPHDPPNDFYMQSGQVTSASEDLTNPRDLSVRLGDYGTASWFDKHLTEWIQPEKLRAPEVILGAQWDYKVDIWSLGLIIWELAEAQILFDGSETPKAPYTESAHLAQMTSVFGPFPEDLLSRSSRASRYFDEAGKLLSSCSFPPSSLDGFCRGFEAGSTDRANFLDMLGSMLRLSPEDRPDAKSLLDSKWLHGV